VGVLFLLGIVVIIGEGLADFVAEVFEFRFLTVFVGSVAGDDFFLSSGGGGEVLNGSEQQSGFVGENDRSFVFPNRLEAAVIEECADGATHVEAVDIGIMRSDTIHISPPRDVNAKSVRFCTGAREAVATG
jgi:hypothetical protein